MLVTSLDQAEESAWLAALRATIPAEELVPANGVTDPARFDVAIVANPRPEQLAPFAALRFVQSLWAGVEKIVSNAALPLDVPLARLIDPTMSQTMAEAVAAHVLALHRNHPHYRRAQNARRWDEAAMVPAHARAVAFLGTGELARASLALLAHLGFERLAWSRAPRPIDGVRTFAGHEGLRAMLAQTDILVNLLPLTPATRGIVDGRLLSALKPGAALVNVARGGHVVDADLLAALDAGQLGEAVLDVFHDEPLPPDHPFWAHPRIQVFPHVAGPTDMVSAAAVAAANIRAFREGRPIIGLVDRGRGY